ncbi:MAG: AAA family ATPase [Synechococcaceae cyanobacterium]|nr:AAA family ATPase [Synechococcaceae cyanobacterium]
MRIAISGTHSLGKSTMVWDWVHRHPRYTREEEPYRALCDWYSLEFRQASTRLHNGLQLLYNVSRVNRYHSSGADVIFDRAPVDYIAYSQYTANHGTTDISDAFVESLVATVRDSLAQLDLLVFVPITDLAPVAMEDDGIRPIDLDYRDEVDSIFKDIYRHDRFQLMPECNPPELIEIWGSRQERLLRLEQAIARRSDQLSGV